MTYRRTRQDLIDILEIQLSSLVEKCLAFDSGDRTKAYEMSGILRTLLKHKGSSKSLLKQLGLREEIRFDQTFKEPNFDIIISSVAVIVKDTISVEDGIDYLPYFTETESPKFISFEDWYNQIVLFYKNHYSISRSELIDIVAEKFDVHVDPSIDEKFHELINATNEAIGWNWTKNGILHKHISTPILSTIRQISHELLVSLRPHLLQDIDLNDIYFSMLGEIKRMRLDHDIKLLDTLKYHAKFFRSVGENFEVIKFSKPFKWLSKKGEPLLEELLKDKINNLVMVEIENRIKKKTIMNGENEISISDSIMFTEDLYGVIFTDRSERKIIRKIDLNATIKVLFKKIKAVNT